MEEMNRSTCGKALNSKYWIPDSKIIIKGIIFISHGWSEHSEWYESFGTELSAEGFLCASHDCIGRSDFLLLVMVNLYEIF